MSDLALIVSVGALFGGALGLLFMGLSPASEAPGKTGASRKALIELLPDRRILIVIGAVSGAGLVWALTAHPLMCFLTLVGLAVIPNKIYTYLRQRRIALIDSQVPDMLAMAAGAMSAGAALMTALESVARDGPAPIKVELDMMLREVRLGIDMDIALDNLAARVKSEEMIMVAAAIKIARESGGNLSESLEKLSRAVRDRQNMEKKILALTAQGRMQAWVMAALPFGMLYALFRLDPVAMGPMFHTVLGWAVFLAVSVWITIGFKVIRKIMDIDI
ncbi:MAG: type II secretion system F family protein [Candidatus Accumulibacter sp.]|jgi:tight adherence protein B|nr:type II secretion system F family protein [Accumulibacter sp.]